MMGYPCSSYDHPAEGTGIIPVAKGCGGCRWDRVENALGYKGGVQVRVVSVDDLLCQFSRFWVSCRLFAGMYSVLWNAGMGYAGTGGSHCHGFHPRRIALRIGHPCTPGLLDPFAPWITGWSNSIGQVTSSAVGGLNNDPGQREEASTTGDYVPSHWQVYLQTALILFLHTIISSMPTRWIATFNSRGLGGHRPST
ncbi:hypothetical protein VTN31DRAFT_3100 [Thermomyces dupontii]|uniref:uncharacterized protein n=1 Tax=Talaromyces thermophilus TaxID=28565 RepID=UPI0037431577